MRRWAVVALLGILALPANAARRVSVAELQQILTAESRAGKSDTEIARQIGNLELTEQLSALTRSRIDLEVKPGAKTALALDLLTGPSGLLDPPLEERLARPAPDSAAQKAMLIAAVEFAGDTFRHLPDFLALRTTRRFDNSPAALRDGPEHFLHGGPAHFVEYGLADQAALHLTGSSTQEIAYRNGSEVASEPARTSAGQKQPEGFTTVGEFGPLLATVLTDSADGAVTWSHWEQAPEGPAAVFHFRIPREASHKEVHFCCVRNPMDLAANPTGQANKANSYDGSPAYGGSLALDPATGAVLRISVDSELDPADPIVRSVTWVQYGKVEIGGKTFICPTQSMALSVIRSQPEGVKKRIVYIAHQPVEV